jgi:multisubunit Na+/H+ antiporter MnhC subunit
MSFDSASPASRPLDRNRVARLLLIDATVLGWVLVGVTIALLPEAGIIELALGLGLASSAVNLAIMRQLGTAPRRRARAPSLSTDAMTGI